MSEANIIRFDKDVVDIDCIIKIGFTKRAYQDLLKLTGNPEGYIAALSGLRRLILTPGRDEEKMFHLHTTFGTFLCSVNQKTGDGFSVITYREIDLYTQNLALKHGVIFSANNGLAVEVLLPNDDISYKYLSGHKYEYNAVDTGGSAPAVWAVLGALSEARAKSGMKGENTPFPTDGQEVDHPESDEELIAMRELLKQAEQYSLLSGELEEKKTNEMGRMTYRSFGPVDYERTDRVAYVFEVDEIDKNVFKPGVQVDVEGRRGDRLSGEIIETDRQGKDGARVTILFNRQVGLDMFPSFGRISLSYSTVNKDVQIGANERIKNGTAKAAFLKHVFGSSSTRGFEHKDLRKVNEALQQQKYPPNESQMCSIAKGINTRDIFLVMGPPGTGKTTVILEWVKYFVHYEHKRVLVSSQNNKAVDNVLARLAEEKDIDVIRIGSEAKLQQEVIPYMFENKLSALNKNIDRATRETTDALEQSIAAWEAYRSSFFVFDRQLKQIKMIDESAKDAIRDNVLPVRQKMREQYDTYMRAGRERGLAVSRLPKCEAAVQSYENKNIILKKLMEKQHLKNVEEQKQLETTIASCNGQMKTAAERYNRYASLYDAQKQLIREKYVTEMKHAQKKAVAGTETFRAKTPDVPHIAGLFEFVRPTLRDLQSAVSLSGLLSRIDEEVQRAKALLSAETAWRDAVVGKQHYALNEIILETVDLVGATCIGVSSQKRFANLQFDITIIDEAGQIQIHNALVPMSVSEKLIMLGDYQQIPPSADQELIELCKVNDVDPSLLEMSLFEKLFKDLPDSNKMMLDTQYRMPGEIADTISEWFYNGEYKSPDFKRSLPGLLPAISKKPYIIIDTSESGNRYETRTPEHGTLNRHEAEICRDILRFAMKSVADITTGEIGVISAYKDQVSTIRKLLSGVVSPEEANAMVATLDSFQGQERDLVLYSFTKSSKKKPEMRRIGFLNELRRLNVAMSRCKKTLIMIGDMHFLSGCLYQDTDEDGNARYDHSEKEFSDFIKKMLLDAKDGRGEVISAKQLYERMGV